jgi:hypothetical protein
LASAGTRSRSRSVGKAEEILCFRDHPGAPEAASAAVARPAAAAADDDDDEQRSGGGGDDVVPGI